MFSVITLTSYAGDYSNNDRGIRQWESTYKNELINTV